MTEYADSTVSSIELLVEQYELENAFLDKILVFVVVADAVENLPV